MNNNSQILQFLSSLGIGVTSRAVENLEKTQIGDFNKLFWDIPTSSSVMAVMDNNQADCTTKSYSPLKDEHHVDCINVLQVVKPVGNLTLNKMSKPFDELDESFIDPTEAEKESCLFLPNVSFHRCCH